VRPDQDGDSIGGAVDITTRSALDRDGPAAFVEAALSYRHILEGYDHYRYKNPGYEGAFSYSDALGADRKWAVEISGNLRGLTSQKQRASVYDWIDASDTATPAYLLEGFILQDFFDHLTNSGLSAAVDYRPDEDNKFRLTAAYNLRDTVRGRQRQVIWFDDELGYDDFFDAAPAKTGDTYTQAATTYNSFDREVREFHEQQSNLNLALTGESRLGDITLNYLAGYNRGRFEGDPDRDIWARFRTGYDSTNTYTITPGDAYFPTITTSENRNDPSLYALRSLDLSTDTITDDETDLGLDAKLDREIAGHPGFLKFGAKARLRGRERDHHDRYYLRNRDWTITGYDGDSSIPSLVADYRATSLVDGRYDYGFYLDPSLTRRTALALIQKGLLESDGESDFASQLYSYKADEDITAAYAMGQVELGKFTVLGGLRVENTRVEFDTYQVVTDASGESLVPISPSHSYTNLMPGLHLRYDFTPKLSLRGAYTHTIARPTFSDLNPREFLDREELTISRGRIDLKPVTSDNLDLSLDYYLGSVGYVSAAVFYKRLRNNIYTPDGIDEVIDGDTYTVSEPRNAPGGHVAGIELGYEQQFRFLPEPLDGLGVSANWTHADSRVETGLAIVPETQLFDQVKDTVNAGLFYEKGRWRARLAWLYRSSTVPADYGINQTHPEIGRVIAGSTSLDATASCRFARQWTVFVEFQNLLNTPGRAYDGDSRLRSDYIEYTDWNAQIGLRWNL
jgi:TonB-dependent receptor